MLRKYPLGLLFYSIITALAAVSAKAQPPLEAYGALPSIRSMTISPSGDKLAFLSESGETSQLAVLDLQTGLMTGVDTSKVKARDVDFISDEYIIIRASATVSRSIYVRDWEFSAAFAFNIETNKVVQLLRKSPELALGQSTGTIVGIENDGKHVFMAAYSAGGLNSGAFDVFRVRLSTGRGNRFRRGTAATRDWILTGDGAPLIREDFNDRNNVYRLFADSGDGLQKIFEGQDNFRAGNVLGLFPDGRGILFSRRTPTGSQLTRMSFSGELQSAPFSRAESFVEAALISDTRELEGVTFTGPLPSYEFLSPKMNAAAQKLGRMFPSRAVRIDDWTPDYSKIIVHVSGSLIAPTYFLFDVEQDRLMRVESSYMGIPDDSVAEVIAIRFPARDGTLVPSILTFPKGKARQKLPMIALPHGGPEAYDSVGFDWLAQYFASRGYLVFQPNFRGSGGFGQAWVEAGYGGWGRGVMQHDVTDGVKSLARSGWADPERVCIIGASYGGYAALAGGAYTPDLYRCVAAIAPVSDLRLLLRNAETGSRGGKESLVYDYWRRSIGADPDNLSQLDEISPAKSANQFVAPVLLIHGLDDTVVPIRQSREMERALKRAGKDVTFIKLKGEDHWLSTSETRLATLKALDQFTTEHLGDAQ